MAQSVELKANTRVSRGKGGAREIRRHGQIPAVIYGDKAPPETITLGYHDVWQQVKTGQFLSTVYVLDIDGKKSRAIPREIQLDPVRDRPLHIDFLRVSKDSRITVDVSVNFLNESESPGLKRGGILNIVRHQIELICLADAIPDRVDVDLTGLDIGDSVHISSVTLPEAAELTITDRNFTIATIVGAAPTEAEEDAAEATELAEGEEAEAEADGEEPKESSGESE